MSNYTEIEQDVPTQPLRGQGQRTNGTTGAVNAGTISSGNGTGTGTGTGTGIGNEPGFMSSTLARLKKSSHPGALLFYIFFRLAPIFMYIFGDLVLRLFTAESRFILHFILLVLLISADFWNLKNISGRLLVGLRWWNETKAGENSDFENVWVFETADPNRYINPIDSKVFWTLLYVQPVAWVVLGLMAVLKFELLYLILILISISLSLTNTVAFTKCDKFGRANDMANSIFSRATAGVFSKINPFA